MGHKKSKLKLLELIFQIAGTINPPTSRIGLSILKRFFFTTSKHQVLVEEVVTFEGEEELEIRLGQKILKGGNSVTITLKINLTLRRYFMRISNI